MTLPRDYLHKFIIWRLLHEKSEGNKNWVLHGGPRSDRKLEGRVNSMRSKTKQNKKLEKQDFSCGSCSYLELIVKNKKIFI